MAIIAGFGTSGTLNASLSGGGSGVGRDFFDTVNTCTSAGTVETLSIYVGGTPTIKVKVWRDDGTNFVFIGSSTLTSALVDGLNTDVSLTTPIAVLTGDIVSLHITPSGSIRATDTTPDAILWSGASSDETATVTKASRGTSIPRYMNFTANGTPSASGTITVTTPQYRIWQRGGSDDASVTIEGTYAGSPTTIERNVDSGGWVEAIASPSGDVWSDTFTIATGQHTVEYRFSNDTGVTDSVSNIAVGDIFACAGQSNMSGRGTSNQTFANSAGGVTAYLFGNDDNFKLLVDPYDSSTGQVDSVSSDGSAAGSWLVRFANEWLANSEVPIGFIPTAKGGSLISAWARDLSASTLYGSMKRRIDEVGGVAAVLWQQGESDAADANNTAGATYQAALEQLAADINSDFGVNTFVVPLHTITAASYTNQATIRQAQIDAAAASSLIDIGQVLTDIDLSSGDGLHFKTNADLDTVATRMYSDYTSSILNVSVSGVPDGSYRTVILTSGGSVVHDASISYVSGSATITGLTTGAGVTLTGYVIDNEATHVSGAVITGVTA